MPERAQVLIIDDEAHFREDLAALLREEGYGCQVAADGDEGLRQAQALPPDVVLCDIAMPGRSGIEILDDLVRACPEACIFMITAHGALQHAVEAFRKGATDYILKPLLLEDVLVKIERYLAHRELVREVDRLRRKISAAQPSQRLVGESPQIRRIRDLVQKLATTRSSVLLLGESGTGKEVVARALHEASPQADKPFVSVNCAALPQHLLESELFGHKRGGFTGAVRDKPGLFELAHGGTILLDEISETSADFQSKLLRVLEERRFRPVGGTEEIPVDVRVIATTNRDLKQWVQEGRFREDLFYRLCVVELRVPPLRERLGDIPLLVEHFIEVLNQKLARRVRGVEPEAQPLLMAYGWPGNVRELENVLERAMILGDGEMVRAGDLPLDVTGGEVEHPQAHGQLRDAVKAFEQEFIRQALNETGGNREATAKLLGINVATLYRKLAEHQIVKK